MVRETLPKLIAARQRAIDARSKSVGETVRLLDEATPLDITLRDTLRKLVAINVKEADERSAESLAEAQSKGQQILLWGGLAAAAALLLGIFLSRHITQPLVQVTLAAERIADGDLDVRVNIAQRDEIGQLADAQRKMVERLRGIILEIRRLRSTWPREVNK